MDKRLLKEGKEPKLEEAFRKINKFCTVFAIILMYILALLSGLYQELTVYSMEINTTIAQTADEIINDEHSYGEVLLEGAEYLRVAAPKGTGDFIAVFNEEEVWVVSELSTLESVRQVSVFTIMDLLTYIITLCLVKKYYRRYNKSIVALCIYQTVFLMFAWITDAYCWQVLFRNSWLSPVQTAVRLIGLSFTVAIVSGILKRKPEKSESIRKKKNRKQ